MPVAREREIPPAPRPSTHRLNFRKFPKCPKLRPPGAESELLVISRQIQYASRQGPHPDNVIEAMTKKYGTPNILLKKPGSSGELSLLGWVFDASGKFVENAEGSSCDLLSPTGYDLKELAHHYTVLMGGASGVFNPVWVSPACGLTMTTENSNRKRRLRLADHQQRL